MSFFCNLRTVYLAAKMSITIITSQTPGLQTYIRRLFRYRGLLVTLIERDFKVRYAQTVLGLLWAVLQPLAGVAIFTFFFSFVIKLDTGDIPYPLIALSGMVSWNYFSFVVNQGSTSLIAAQALIKKVNFPKLHLVLAKAVVGLVEMGIALLILLLWVIFTGRPLSPALLLLPVVVLLNLMTGLSVALWLSALTVKFRDLQHLIPYVITFGIWLTPVFYPSTIIPESLEIVNYFNPMAAVIESLRFCMLGTAAPDPRYVFGIGVMVLLLVSGFLYFKKTEVVIPDYI
jgi:lipopolysaccharide transport system permease protein